MKCSRQTTCVHVSIPKLHIKSKETLSEEDEQTTLDTPFGKGLVTIKQLELTERVFWREMDESKGDPRS
ncbi:unnamed protein product [Rhizophagus irregularis]|nr:unnamed protein product [Rhizophagus irregularis]